MNLSPKVPALLLLSLFFVVACAPATTKISETARAKISKIAILPVTASVDAVVEEGNQVDIGVMVLTKLLDERFGDNSAFVIISEPEARNLPTIAVLNANPVRAAREIGEKTASDAILYLQVERYSEREGVDLGMISPASVSFAMQLFAAETGNKLCSGRFEETQQSLFENMLGFSKAMRRGFKWVSAHRLAEDGLREKIAECPYLEP